MPCWIALYNSITTEGAEAGAPAMDEARLKNAVASLALAFTPRVALVDEAVLLDVTGSLRLFGGLARLMQLLEQRLTAFFGAGNLQAVTQRAQGATSLIALGRLRSQREIAAGGTSATTARLRLADLPMHTLSAARPHHGVLERTGCRTWDDLLRLPRDGVARRFGADLLLALDRALGLVADDYDWLVLPEHFDEKLELNALVEHAPALMAGIEHLLLDLQAWLLGRQSGLCALKVVWHLDKRRDVAPSGELEIRTAKPAQDLRHMARLVSEHLAQNTLPAPVHSVSLQSLVTERLQDAAAATGSLLIEARKNGDGAVELVERLSARLGDAGVQAWQPCADHKPEQMQRWVNARDAIQSLAGRLRGHGRDAGKRPTYASAGRSAEQAGRMEALYPSWLLPEPLRLATHGNNPVHEGALVRLAGPQRVESTGWLLQGEGPYDRHDKREAAPAIRDYFIYRSMQGSLLWIYRERLKVPREENQLRFNWYLHGFFA
ncbi:MAG: DNA polymerase Y family protein [Pseudomonadota bacterium]